MDSTRDSAVKERAGGIWKVPRSVGCVSIVEWADKVTCQGLTPDFLNWISDPVFSVFLKILNK